MQPAMSVELTTSRVEAATLTTEPPSHPGIGQCRVSRKVFLQQETGASLSERVQHIITAEQATENNGQVPNGTSNNGNRLRSSVIARNKRRPAVNVDADNSIDRW